MSIASTLPVKPAPAATCDEHGYGDDHDSRAIGRIVAQLRTRPNYRRADEDELFDKAEDLYAMVCRKVRAGAEGEQLTKIAGLLGEQPDELVARLAHRDHFQDYPAELVEAVRRSRGERA